MMNAIRAARAARGWTQAQLAARASLSPRTIHAMEQGRNCRQASKRQVLRALGVPWQERAAYFPPPPPREPLRAPANRAGWADQVRETA